MSGIVFAFGRMNPPTKGHEILVNKVIEIANKYSFDHEIVVSTTHDNVRNPLSPKQKLAYLLQYFPNINISPTTKEFPTIIDWIVKLNRQYDKLYLVCGFDRMKEYKNLIEKYNGIEYNYKYVEIIESGNLVTRENFSGTLVRNLVSSPKIRGMLDSITSVYTNEDQIIDMIKTQIPNNKDLQIFLSCLIDNKDEYIKYYLLLDLYYASINIPKK